MLARVPKKVVEELVYVIGWNREREPSRDSFAEGYGVEDVLPGEGSWGMEIAGRRRLIGLRGRGDGGQAGKH